MLELAKDPSTTTDEFQEAANKLKVETGYDIWLKLFQVRGVNDTVKLQPNKKQGASIPGSGGVKDRDSFTLKLFSNSPGL